MIERCIKISLAFGLTFAMALTAGAATAQPAADSPLAQSMAACGRIVNIQQRVACYDALNESANPAATKEPLDAKRRDFGFSLPRVGNPFAAPKAAKQARAAAKQPTARQDEGVNHILARLDHSSRGPTGQLILTTTEGAVWLLDDDSSALQPKQGTEFLIRRGAMGALFCDLDNWRAIRCKRLQ